MKHLSAWLFGVVTFVAGVSSANALVLCANASGNVVALDQCKAGMTPLNPVAVGLVGPAGPQGVQGPQGAQGTQGTPGTGGTSTILGTKAITTIGKAYPGVPWTTMVTVNLDAGTYLLSGDGIVNRLNNKVGSGIAVNCQFTSGGVSAPPYLYFSVLVGDTVPVAIAGRVTLAAAGNVTIECAHQDFDDTIVEGIAFELLAQGVILQVN